MLLLRLLADDGLLFPNPIREGLPTTLPECTRRDVVAPYTSSDGAHLAWSKPVREDTFRLARSGRTGTLILADGHLEAEFVEEVQQDGNAVGALLLLLCRLARIHNNRKALAVRRKVVRVINAKKFQVLLGPNLGLSSGKGPGGDSVIDDHYLPIGCQEEKLAPAACPDGVVAPTS